MAGVEAFCRHFPVENKTTVTPQEIDGKSWGSLIFIDNNGFSPKYKVSGLIDSYGPIPNLQPYLMQSMLATSLSLYVDCVSFSSSSLIDCDVSSTLFFFSSV
ncbi:hypothetical protein SAY87_029505 [Trapa incisa]|uniref:Uncharacterized protein n=1 Tax=Trapa incisa TaxID=236973 RepID=A0AAN7K7M0_9MYRT|nr:hypothetical protein SAY87_029505 [Trapa incisa]